MADDVELAYSRRAGDYIELLGSMDSVHPADEHLVLSWAAGCTGDIIDAGCGPGHWTDALDRHGHTALGVDQVPEFVDRARATYPDSSFSLGSLEHLDAAGGSIGGVLAWYSLIHQEPDQIGVPLREFHRVLRSGGELLLGFFEGSHVERFDHAVVAAHRWPVADLCALLDIAGFDVIETHTRTSADHRPHAAIHARRR